MHKILATLWIPAAAFLMLVFASPVSVDAATGQKATSTPSTVGASDTTGDVLADVTALDATCDPVSLSAATNGDTCYFVEKGLVMHFSAFDMGAIPPDATITGVILFMRWGGENGLSNTNFVQYDMGAGLVNTTIRPYDRAGFEATTTNLYAAGVDTRDEISAFDIQFTNNDGAGADGVTFDVVSLQVTYSVATYSQSGYKFFEPNDGVQVGNNQLAALNTPATTTSASAQFRLRMLQHVADTTSSTSTALSLEFAERSGTCDTAYSGESWAEVTTSSAIAYYDNTTPLDGVSLTSTTTDPTHGGDTVRAQTYEDTAHREKRRRPKHRRRQKAPLP